MTTAITAPDTFDNRPAIANAIALWADSSADATSARRHDLFPHEPTGDQFFSEEQFEVYRALGFHITNRLLKGDDDLQVVGTTGAALSLLDVHPNVDEVRAALLG